jgi:peptidoglycan biosynthesis protein MviN/MurJ (putative lipid II flippase)
MNDVEMTSLSLVAYAYALPFLLSSKFFNSVFFAANKTKFVLFLGLVSLVLNLILNYIFIFVYDMGHVGLALATTFAVISVWTIAVIYLFSLRKILTT